MGSGGDIVGNIRVTKCVSSAILALPTWLFYPLSEALKTRLNGLLEDALLAYILPQIGFQTSAS